MNTSSISSSNTKVKLCGMNSVPLDIYPISNNIDIFTTECNTNYLDSIEIKIYLPIVIIFSKFIL